MRHLPLSVAITLIAAAIWLAGCGTPPTPRIEVREVKIPVAVACAADPGPDPTYPDTDEALRNVPDVATGVRLITAGRLLRDARIGELKAALAGCAASP